MHIQNQENIIIMKDYLERVLLHSYVENKLGWAHIIKVHIGIHVHGNQPFNLTKI